MYQFLSITDLQLCRSTCKSLRRIRALSALINDVQFIGKIPSKSNGNIVSPEFLNQPEHSLGAAVTSAYLNRLRVFKQHIQMHPGLKVLFHQPYQVTLNLQSPQPKKSRHHYNSGIHS